MYSPSHITLQALMTFLPSFLMISISYATSFFRLPSFFNTAITVSPSIDGGSTTYTILRLLTQLTLFKQLLSKKAIMPSYDMAISLSGPLSKKWSGVNGVGDTP